MSGTVIVTGGGRGIGAATAELSAAAGYAVCVNYYQNEHAATATVGRIEAAGGRAAAIAADVGDESQVRTLFDAAEETLGPVAALVNNAGILEKQAPFAEIDSERFSRILRTNVLGAFYCAQEALRRMSTVNGGGGGSIVNVSSVAARTGSPFEYVDYAASKGALDTMTAGLAREAAPQGVRVNLVRPGFIYTDMHASGGEPGRVDRLAPNVPLRRGGSAEEVARAILWLMSPAAGYVVGAMLDITGGV
jgi:NAD(P)-dependent dehydrogenase (short-subunit alcohol dehydrogenase family)